MQNCYTNTNSIQSAINSVFNMFGFGCWPLNILLSFFEILSISLRFAWLSGFNFVSSYNLEHDLTLSGAMFQILCLMLGWSIWHNLENEWWSAVRPHVAKSYFEIYKWSVPYLENAAKRSRQHARIQRRSFSTERSSSTKCRLPPKIVFPRRSSSTKGHLSPMVVFHRRSSSTKGRLPLRVVFHHHASCRM